VNRGVKIEPSLVKGLRGVFTLFTLFTQKKRIS
jgi:hypothetical protein